MPPPLPTCAIAVATCALALAAAVVLLANAMAPISALPLLVINRSTVAAVCCWTICPLAGALTVAVAVGVPVTISPKKQGLPGGVARSQISIVSAVVAAPGKMPGASPACGTVFVDVAASAGEAMPSVASD